MYTVEAITEDDKKVEFECGPNEDLITAALRNNVILLSSCREGSCATCKAECIEGEFELSNCSVQALPSNEEEDGFVLMCGMYPRSDIVVRLPYVYERISFGKQNVDWTGDVVACDRLSSNVFRLVIQCKDPDTNAPLPMPFTAGQYVNIEIPGTGISRSFSMANPPGSTDLEFLIRMLPTGRFSEFLANGVAVGQAIKFRGPTGIFALRENGLRPRYFIAGGTGLSPVLSMIRRMRDVRDPHPVKLFFGVTHQHELFYEEELEELRRSMPMPNMLVNIAVMNPSDTWHGFKGTVVDLLRTELSQSNEKPDIYMCGPPAMIEATVAAAVAAEVPDGSIYFEKFLASG
ncbi:MAG: 2Fe-2S iron-sulfur cluster binding domain-containing protein [Acidiphilium sp.]|nr:2Fe-2S iron-sulfur cluster binding domain-containing protein [Acidiphilium sp.]MDD4935526.1 2Fe-2S iron-sulfur cluster binding domain-containing protein [Acidiphilium sp.]